MEQNLQKNFIITKNPSGQGNTKSSLLYEEVISKNFEIISQLLEKLNKIFARQEEIALDVNSSIKRIAKMESEMEAIHNEHRRQNLHIYSKIDSLKDQVQNVNTHMRIVIDQLKDRGMPYYISHQKDKNSQKQPNRYQFHNQREKLQNMKGFTSRSIMTQSEGSHIKSQKVSPSNEKGTMMMISNSRDEKAKFSQFKRTNHAIENSYQQTLEKEEDVSEEKKVESKSMNSVSVIQRKNIEQSKQKRKMKNSENKEIGNRKKKNSLLKTLEFLKRDSIKADEKSKRRSEQTLSDEDHVPDCSSTLKKNHEINSRDRSQKKIYFKIDESKNYAQPSINYIRSMKSIIDRKSEKVSKPADSEKRQIEEAEEAIIKFLSERLAELKSELASHKKSILSQLQFCFANIKESRREIERVKGLNLDIEVLKKYSCEHYANKKETKRALLFLEQKINSFLAVLIPKGEEGEALCSEKISQSNLLKMKISKVSLNERELTMKRKSHHKFRNSVNFNSENITTVKSMSLHKDGISFLNKKKELAKKFKICTSKDSAT